jgi:hypothetical protein
MPVPIEFGIAFREAYTHLEAGRLADAESAVFQLEARLKRVLPALTPLEVLLWTAAIATVLRRCGSIDAAVLRLEDVCELALRLEPSGSRTVGDLCMLAECYMALGKLSQALTTFRTARPIAVVACADVVPSIDGRIRSLAQQVEPESPSGAASVRVDIECPAVNYSLAHAGLPVLSAVRVRNEARAPIEGGSLQVAIPGYTLPGDAATLALAAGETTDVSDRVRLNFALDRLLTQTERARAWVDASIDGRLAGRQATWVLAYDECSWQPGHEKVLAAFVHPNNSAVRVVAEQAARLLPQAAGAKSYHMVRESQLPDRIDRIVRAIYDCLKDHYQLVYDYEPPSWESTSQRVRFPDDVIVSRIGTCVDLMLLATSVLENVLVGSPAQPVMVIIGGATRHALIGCWRRRPRSSEAVITDQVQVGAWVRADDLFVMDSTGFASGNPFWTEPVDFERCVVKGQELLARARRIYALNLAALRPDPETHRPGITPLPFRREPPYGERALLALWLSRQAWRALPTTRIQSTHLLAGLLQVTGGAAPGFFDLLAGMTANPRLTSDNVHTHLVAGLGRIARSPSAGEPDEAEGFSIAKTAAKSEAARLHAAIVEDLHLLLALFRRPGASVDKALQQLGTSPAECLALLEHIHPAAGTPVRSEFPSEILDSPGDR